jgi:hypothetical protein
MRFAITRHLGELSAGQAHLEVAAFGVSALRMDGAWERRVLPVVPPPPEFNGPDYVSFLLSIDAELEHALMVQYLYAAYSLGGPQVPKRYRDQVRGWQEIVLGIAKEEMGHLISVQNVLRLIGAPLHFAREDYPWDTPFYPYPFMLEPLTLTALAKYIFAESPAGWSGPLADEIKKLLPKTTSTPHPVGELFDELLLRLKDRKFLPDEIFQPETWPFQAKWDEWGRGYQGGARGNTGRAPASTPDVLAQPVASRDDAVASVTKIAEQGEAPLTANMSNPSHFARFVKVYEEMKALQPVWKKGKWTPWRNVAVNPYVPEAGGASPRTKQDHEPITHPEAVLWGSLFNVRYRMVLAYLIHSFDLAGGLNETRPWSPRGTIISAAFGEMYNMRAIATFLVQTPLSIKPGAKDKSAGPPFQMPYTLDRPTGEANRWRLHRNLLLASAPLVERLLALSHPSRHRYLNSVREADQSLLGVIDRILGGHSNFVPR